MFNYLTSISSQYDCNQLNQKFGKQKVNQQGFGSFEKNLVAVLDRFEIEEGCKGY